MKQENIFNSKRNDKTDIIAVISMDLKRFKIHTF
jgi:hypothetical protein